MSRAAEPRKAICSSRATVPRQLCAGNSYLRSSRATLAMSPGAVSSRSSCFRQMPMHCYRTPPGEMSLSMPIPGRGDDVRPGHRSYYVIWYRPVRPDQLRDLMTDQSGRDHGLAIPPPLIRADVIAAMRRDAVALLPPMFADVIARTEQPLLQAITDLEVPRMAFGRVALLGDAAFVARPHVAAGITKAALDAAALAEELGAGPDDISSALARYEAKRLTFGRALVDYSRKLGAASLAPDAIRDPERVMREYGAPHLVHDVERTG